MRLSCQERWIFSNITANKQVEFPVSAHFCFYSAAHMCFIQKQYTAQHFWHIKNETSTFDWLMDRYPNRLLWRMSTKSCTDRRADKVGKKKFGRVKLFALTSLARFSGSVTHMLLLKRMRLSQGEIHEFSVYGVKQFQSFFTA